jgi:hypothetical protein
VRRVTIEVDESKLFDMISADPILKESAAERLLGELLAPGGFAAAIGLAMYGITVIENDGVEPTQQEEEGDG